MMATKNWEPQSWTKLIEGIQYMYSMYWCRLHDDAYYYNIAVCDEL
jgi:hypothetical protein